MIELHKVRLSVRLTSCTGHHKDPARGQGTRNTVPSPSGTNTQKTRKQAALPAYIQNTVHAWQPTYIYVHVNMKALVVSSIRANNSNTYIQND